MISTTFRQRLVKFCRLRLGLKPIIDYAQCRSRLMGVADLPIRTVFDIGANVGKKSRQYRKLFPEATIYCFEPVPDCHERLSRWARRQQGKVKTFHFALGNESGETTIHWNTKHSGGSSLIAPRSGALPHIVPLPTKIERLDTIAADLDVRDQILVKIDVEGYDMEVIKGGRGVIERAAAVIVEIPLYSSPIDRPDFAQFVATMRRLGYMYRGNLNHAYVQGVAAAVDAVFVKPPEARRAAA